MNREVLNMEDVILESMIDTAINNLNVRRVEKGTLILDYDSIKVIDNNNNKYFLTYCPYEYEGEDLNKRFRNKMNKAFMDKYTYDDIRNKFKAIQEEKIKKAEKAENTKYILENLVNNELSVLNQYGTIELLANNHTIEYYIEFKRNYSINLRISLTEKENIFNVSYNYDREVKNIEELKEIVNNIVDISNKEIEEANRKREEERREREIYNKRLELAREIQSGKKVIVKLKSGYQCLQKGIRYSVGTGKSGKFYKLSGLTGIVDYLIKKDINKYIFIDNDDKTYNLTNEILKGLNYNNIA